MRKARMTENLYTSNGEVRGFSDRSFEDVVMNVVYGTPEWVDVRGLSISPDYPYNASAGPNETYSPPSTTPGGITTMDHSRKSGEGG